jgi:hypothetical protein
MYGLEPETPNQERMLGGNGEEVRDDRPPFDSRVERLGGHGANRVQLAIWSSPEPCAVPPSSVACAQRPPCAQPPTFGTCGSSLLDRTTYGAATPGQRKLRKRSFNGDDLRVQALERDLRAHSRQIAQPFRAQARNALRHFLSLYSLRSIATASPRVARRRGTYEASAEAQISSNVAPRIVDGSRGSTGSSVSVPVERDRHQLSSATLP